MRKRTTNICPYGHELSGTNVRVRHDRNGAIECVACQRRGMAKFREKRPVYDVWKTMLRRCSDPTFIDWHLYGGRTPPIAVCERWKASYEDFAADMGPRPDKRHTIDRIDGTQGYFPENCRWASPKEQARNMSTNHLVTFDGRTMTIAEWAERSGLKYMTLFMRLKRGWSVQKALQP